MTICCRLTRGGGTWRGSSSGTELGDPSSSGTELGEGHLEGTELGDGHVGVALHLLDEPCHVLRPGVPASSVRLCLQAAAARCLKRQRVDA